MQIQKLEKQLFQLREREIFHKNNPNYISEYYRSIPTKKINKKEYLFFDELIDTDKNFNITQHTRYAPVPAHVHNFIEINYVYSGKCHQFIDDHEVILKKGNIVIIDTETPHSIENTSQEDIIINILIKKKHLLKILSHTQLTHSLILNFVLTSLSDVKNHNQYIVFNNDEDERIRTIIQQILIEKFEHKSGEYFIIDNLINVLFTLLVRENKIDIKQLDEHENTNIFSILADIDANFMEISLEKLAEKFNYSPSYLSTLIKRETNLTFSQLILEKKLNLAQSLIKNQKDSITVCAQKAGFSNITYFYKKYKEKFGENPGQYKNNGESH